MAKCSICKKEFEAKRSDAKYCSPNCRQKAIRSSKKEKEYDTPSSDKNIVNELKEEIERLQKENDRLKVDAKTSSRVGLPKESNPSEKKESNSRFSNFYLEQRKKKLGF